MTCLCGTDGIVGRRIIITQSNKLSQTVNYQLVGVFRCIFESNLFIETSLSPSHRDVEEMGLRVWNVLHGFSDFAFLCHFAEHQTI